VLTAVKFMGSIGFQEIELVFVCRKKKESTLASNNHSMMSLELRTE
jgi:hypothetical protein